MESAPLNLAHFHERRADKYLKRNRFDEGIKAMETALAYIEDAYKIITIPKAVEVLNAEKWNYLRKLKQINIRQTQKNEGSKFLTVPGQSNEPYRKNSLPSDLEQPNEKGNHPVIENFDAKYSLPTLGSLCDAKQEGAEREGSTTTSEDPKSWMQELECKDFPCLAPLELPKFDLE